jgi:predicted MFS family arabinose efflux permease
MLLVLCMVAITAGTAVGMVFNNLSSRLNELSKSGLRGYLELGRQLIDADAVERVNQVRHYRNEDYRNLLSQLRRTITRDGKLQTGTYSGIYKVFGNKVTALAYHDGLRGIFYPYDYDYKASIYATVQEKGKVYLGEIADQYGVWQIGVAPILNRQGACVGMLEVGLDMSARKEANRQLLTKTVISIAMILFVVVFIFLEIGFLNSHVFGHIRDRDAAGMQLYDEGVLRFSAYLALSAVFLPVSFLPLFCKSLAPPLGSLPLDVVIGLPMVVETLCGAVVAVIYGHVHHRLGLKTDIVLACLATAAGMAITSQTETYTGLIVGRVVVGMGMGLLMIAFRTYFVIDSDSARRENGIVALTAGVVAGINTGSVSGAMLASRFGERGVFMLQAELLVLAALFTLFMLRNRRRPPIRVGKQALSMRGFLRSREIWGFFCLAFLPVTACGMFLGFFFPLFAAARGCTEAEIGLAFMLFGLCGVYLGPVLTKITTDAFGAGRSVFVGALIMACGLLFFAYAQTLTAAYVTVLLFGLTDSFIFNQGLGYLCSRRPVARFGEDKALGVYNVFESGGEALGPIMFGLAMSFSLATGVGLIAAMLTLSASLFLVVNKPSKEPPC